ncbi:hypothetical protein [uncultured Thiodictyon sp.]|jgi:hypothetical protein|uniref:hypothetical protein n=1 Tax=uncultured Thiodictyon sp. TaxID=1846217 RepID=UPI0025EDF165|nr:hypothetical protein [uncultured Thiodictyon sp.]
MRFFTTEGPVRPADNYCLPPLQRWDLDEVLGLIDQKKYFLLHAPRQTGKTSCLLALMEYLNQGVRYRAVYANLEVAQAYREQVDKGMGAVVEQISRGARDQLGDAAATGLAREVIINRVTHLDQLADKLREERVRRVIEPMLAGTQMDMVPEDDRQYLVDLGLLRRDGAGGLVIANPIYREVLPRALAGGPQDSLPHISPTWLNADGTLNPAQLLDAFLAFWRRHGQPLLGSAPYHEIAPHLVLMAFLHRVINGSSSPPPVGEGPGERAGTLEREYAIGSGRMDLCLSYGALTLGMELKVWRDGAPDPLAEGLDQLDGYLAGLGLDWGWLVIFDRRAGQPPMAERTLSQAMQSPDGRRIVVVRA